MKFKLSSPTYQYGIEEIMDLCEYYGTKKIFNQEETSTLINSEAVKEDWSHFKLLILQNFDPKKRWKKRHLERYIQIPLRRIQRYIIFSKINFTYSFQFKLL